MNHAKWWYSQFNIQELSDKQKRFRYNLENMPRLSEHNKKMIKNNINIINNVIFQKRVSKNDKN